MKKVFWAAGAAMSIFFFGCLKSASPSQGGGSTACVNVSPADEQTQIQTFIHKDSIPFTQDSTGIYYHIFTPGQGLAANTYSNLLFTYTASTLTDTVLATTTTATSAAVDNLIPGIQLMASYLKKGTHIQLIIPSSYAYGCQGAYNNNVLVIPPNTVILFDLNITDIQ